MYLGLTIFFAVMGQLISGGASGWAKGILVGWLLIFSLLMFLAVATN